MKSIRINVLIVGVLICSGLLNHLFATPVNVAPETNTKIYKVGLPNVPGLMSRDKNGEPKGIAIEMVEQILKDENIAFEWVDGSWSDLFAKIIKGDIDILPGTQKSEDRMHYLDFMQNSIYTIWSELYINPSFDFENPSQLKGQKIGLVKNDNNGIGFLKYISEFNIEIEPVFFDSHMEAIHALEANEIKAMPGPKPSHKGDVFASLKSSGMFFNPTDLTVSFTQGKHAALVKRMDNRLSIYKNDPNSFYYSLFRKYNLSTFPQQKEVFPNWIKLTLVSTFLGLLIALIFLFLLRTQVAVKTKQLRFAKELAEEKEKSKTIFLANMSHEIRTPLNSIVGFSELIAETDITNEQRAKYVQIIGHQNQLLLSLINDILDFAKIESGTIKINLEEINLGSFMNDLFITFEKQFPSQFSFQLKMNPRYNNLLIKTDTYRLGQIIGNFITNAIKYAEKGDVVLGATRSYYQLSIFVKDNGPGIPYPKQEQIFDRFQKIHDFSQGVGLGLAISKSLAELIGGDIQLKSIPGAGSEFSFTINLPNFRESKESVSGN